RRRGAMSSISSSRGSASMGGLSPSTSDAEGALSLACGCCFAPSGSSRSPFRPQAESVAASASPSIAIHIFRCMLIRLLPALSAALAPEFLAPPLRGGAHMLRRGAAEARPAGDGIVDAEHGIYLIGDAGLHLAHFVERKPVEVD